MKKAVLFIFLFSGVFSGFAQKKSKKDYVVTLKTSFGVTHLILFDETPLHKQNFIRLVEKKFYDSLMFHRIIEGFMIQGGDPNSKNAQPGERLGMGGDDMERIPYEFTPKRVHSKGALAAARDGNPAKKSSACQFYIVQGKRMTDDEITASETRNKMKYTPQQRADFIAVGGTPRLDNNYTVFGEVIDNFKLIDDIAAQAKDQSDRPKKDIRMAMTVKKLRKKKITKLYGYTFD